MMKKCALNFMLLTIFSLLCSTGPLEAQNGVSSAYLKGAIPLEDGEILFRKSFNASDIGQDLLMNLTQEWINGRENEAENRSSMVLIFDKEKGSIIAGCNEKLIFKSTAFVLDQADISYNILVTFSPDSINMTIMRVRYKYNDERYTAEELIADNVSLNKDQTKIVKSSKKWRVKTIDFVNDLFNDYSSYLSNNL